MGSLAHAVRNPSLTIPVSRVPAICRFDDDLVVTSRGSPGVRVVEVAGPVDLLTAPDLAHHLFLAVTDESPLVVVDLRRVDFLGAAGLGVLVEADNHARARHTVLRVVASTRAVCRVLRITGLDRTLAVYPALEPALAVPASHG
jgi:anti-sigma B factor antagonist